MKIVEQLAAALAVSAEQLRDDILDAVENITKHEPYYVLSSTSSEIRTDYRGAK